MKNKIAVVTGGTSGIGLETARSLRSRGFTVYTLSRHADPGSEFHFACDVSDESSVKETVSEIVSREGRIDLMICNAGFGISGASEFTANSDAKRLLDVNLFGCVNCCKAVIPHMRTQNSGRIICISSVAGTIPIPFQSWYSVSKAAVLSYASSLRNEIAPFGISVTAILPGDIRTGFTGARQKQAIGDDLYQGRITRSVAVMEHDEQTGMSPSAAGRFIADIACRPSVKPQYSIGFKYRLFLLIYRLLPYRLSSFLVGKIYGG